MRREPLHAGDRAGTGVIGDRGVIGLLKKSGAPSGAGRRKGGMFVNTDKHRPETASPRRMFAGMPYMNALLTFSLCC
jgi:hypothetical protein